MFSPDDDDNASPPRGPKIIETASERARNLVHDLVKSLDFVEHIGAPIPVHLNAAGAYSDVGVRVLDGEVIVGYLWTEVALFEGRLREVHTRLLAGGEQPIRSTADTTMVAFALAKAWRERNR